MQCLRIGFDVVKQNSDLSARMLTEAPPDLVEFGRRLTAPAAAAFPAMDAAAKAVAQLELNGRLKAQPSSPTSNFASVSMSTLPNREGNGGTTTTAVGSRCVCGCSSGSLRKSTAVDDDVGGIGVSPAWQALTAIRAHCRGPALVVSQHCGGMGSRENAGEDGDAVTLTVCGQPYAVELLTSLQVSVNFGDCDMSSTRDCSWWMKLLGFSGAVDSINASSDVTTFFAVCVTYTQAKTLQNVYT